MVAWDPYVADVLRGVLLPGCVTWQVRRELGRKTRQQAHIKVGPTHPSPPFPFAFTRRLIPSV